MRITAGTHRSRILKTLDGEQTRPTSDRVKEAVFSSIGPYFQDETMLDLFGGSGGIALEAVSRGMLEVYVADKNRDAIDIIKTNVAMLNEQEKVHIIRGDYQSVLSQLNKQSFSIIYLDPPYALEVLDEIMEYINEYKMLEEDGVIVVEYAKDKKLNEAYGLLKQYKEKKYGKTKVSYYRKLND